MKIYKPIFFSPPTSTMDYTSNQLYHLIRQRAGSKMLRQAESINMYSQVSEYLDDSHLDSAIQAHKTFEVNYPRGTESHMGHVSLEEITAIRTKDLTDLPWIYVHMLETLSAHDEFAADLLNMKLESSPAAAWRIPLPSHVAEADSFQYVYEEWLSLNPWIESFIDLATADDVIETDDPQSD